MCYYYIHRVMLDIMCIFRNQRFNKLYTTIFSFLQVSTEILEIMRDFDISIMPMPEEEHISASSPIPNTSKDESRPQLPPNKK